MGYIIIAGSLLFKIPQVSSSTSLLQWPRSSIIVLPSTHSPFPSLSPLPQVARIFRKKSAEGISAYMYCMETVGVAMSLLFSIRQAFPFSAYGEAVFILIQNIAILVGE